MVSRTGITLTPRVGSAVPQHHADVKSRPHLSADLSSPVPQLPKEVPTDRLSLIPRQRCGRHSRPVLDAKRFRYSRGGVCKIRGVTGGSLGSRSLREAGTRRPSAPHLPRAPAWRDGPSREAPRASACPCTRDGGERPGDSKADAANRAQSNDNFGASCVLENKKVGIRAGDRGKGAGGPTRIVVTRDPGLTRQNPRTTAGQKRSSIPLIPRFCRVALRPPRSRFTRAFDASSGPRAVSASSRHGWPSTCSALESHESTNPSARVAPLWLFCSRVHPRLRAS